MYNISLGSETMTGAGCSYTHQNALDYFRAKSYYVAPPGPGELHPSTDSDKQSVSIGLENGSLGGVPYTAIQHTTVDENVMIVKV